MLNASHGAVYTLVVLVTALCCLSLTSACVLSHFSSDRVARVSTPALVPLIAVSVRLQREFGLDSMSGLFSRVLDPAALPCGTCSVTFMDECFGGLSIASVLCADDVVLWLHQTRTSTCQRESAPPCLTL